MRCRHGWDTPCSIRTATQFPTASGEVRLPEGQPLSTVAAGSVVRVVHIEDEPASTYRELLAAQLGARHDAARAARRTSEGMALDTGVVDVSIVVRWSRPM